MNLELLVLRLVHVLGGVFWVGSGLFTTFYLAPALARSGADAGRIMAALQARRLFTVLPVVAILTILSGLRLLAIVSDGFGGGYFRTGSGIAFSVAGASATAAFLLATIIGRPATARAMKVRATLAQAPVDRRAELERQAGTLQRRGGAAMATATVLLVAGAAGMAVARYL